MPYTVGEAEAGSLAGVLGREEGLEDLAQRRLVDPWPCVATGQGDVAAGSIASSFSPTVGVRGLDRDRAAVRHRVAGVDDEVHHDLVQLAGVGLDRAERGSSSVVSATSSPISGRQHRLELEHDPFRLSSSGIRTCLRLKASSWRVSSAARSVALADLVESRR
jgi:hypothetical protein